MLSQVQTEYTLLDEYLAAIRRVVSSKDANMQEYWDNMVQVDEVGRQVFDRNPFCRVGVWSPANNPKIKIEIHLGTKIKPKSPPEFHLRLQEDPESNRLQRELIFALENEFDVVRKELAQRKDKDNPTAATPHATANQRSAKIITALLGVLSMLIGLNTNIASTILPKELEPYLWLSWPLLFVLTIFYIWLSIRQ